MVNKEEIKHLAQSPNFIPSIYNYCDGWCKRCDFSGRCLHDMVNEIDKRDVEGENEATIDRIFRMLEIAAEMIEDDAKKLGVDLNDNSHNDPVRNGVGQVLPQHSLRYLRSLQNWTEKYQTILEEFFGGEEAGMHLRIATIDSIDHAELKFALELVNRFSSLIHWKISRALWQPTDEEQGIDNYDANGSAKCALVAIDESIEAWSVIALKIKKASDCGDFIVTLERIRDLLERTLPEARAFERPGFDKKCAPK